MLTIAIANKGRTQQPALRLLFEAGIEVRQDRERSLLVPTSRRDVRVLLARIMDIPLLVERRAADLGITGDDALAERGSRVNRLLPLDFGGCKIALAAPQSMTRRRVHSIATSLPNITRRFCRTAGLDADILRMDGALESAPRLGVADAIVDHVESGDTLRENHLRVLEVIMESSMCLVANCVSVHQKAPEIGGLVLMLQGIMDAKGRVVLKLNAPDPKTRDRLLVVIPAMKSPDVSPLAQPGAFSILAAVPRQGLEALIVKLRRLGGTDIFWQKLDGIVP